MSMRSDIEALRLALARLRSGPAAGPTELLDDIDRLVARIAGEASELPLRELALRGRQTRHWQLLVLALGLLAAATTLAWRWTAPPPAPAVADGGSVQPPATAPHPAPAACPAGLDARSMDAVLDALARARGGSDGARAATLPLGLLSELVQAMVKAGTVTAETGGEMLKALEAEAVKRGGEIAVEIAKGLIDRIIHPRPEPAPAPLPATRAALAGGTVNVYCGLAPASAPAVRPAPAPPRPAPRKAACPAPPQHPGTCPAPPFPAASAATG